MSRFLVLTAAVLLGTAMAQTPGVPEPKTVGDIPDNQAFVRYTNPAGYSLEVPEGWARTVQGSSARFEAKFNRLSVALQRASAAPDVVSVQAGEVKALQKDTSVKVRSVKAVKLPSGSAVLVRYDSQSQPNAVTGQKVLLENNLYLLYKNGQEVLLTLSAPKGADNADAWRRIVESFRWERP
jgi:hypothetical protein